VNNTSMNPIEGARVRVYFHDTYEENFTNSSGYYNVNNIPICYCLKKCTASKNGYKTEQVLLSIVENTTYDFVLAPRNKAFNMNLLVLRFLEQHPHMFPILRHILGL
ncbi:MAG: carboxypeptidase regulatory-like domain-containing protein, partial [Thermoplasmatales archaeon]